MILFTAATLSLLFITTTAKFIPPNNNNLIKLPIIKRPLLQKRASEEGYKLYNEDRIEYLTKIYIGTPPQEFYVSIDTGSADIWVPSTSCPKSQCVLNKFQHKKSNSYKDMNLSFAIQYGQGSISGYYAKDRINLLGPGSKLTIDDQPFGLVDSAIDNIITTTPTKKPTSNGILGLAFPALTANSDTIEAYNPFVFNLAKQGLISKPIFSIYLGGMNEKDWSGQLTIGGIDHEKYTGELNYIPVLKNIDPKTSKIDYTFWSVQLDSIFTTVINKSIILDTGTTLSYLTKKMVVEILKSVTTNYTFDSTSELYMVDCNLKSSNKKVEFFFGGNTVKLSVDISDLILPPVSSNDDQCGFAITYNFDKENTLVLGDSVLRSAYFVFDMEKKRVGIATAINSKSKVSL